ncbi:MAG: holo-ACP synthase [Anaerolineae bacterium]|nr:holo-ACP synthase [Anaerolineae bacterium]
MLRVGLDLISIARVARARARFGERFDQRFFTPEELAICEGDLRRLAARIAAKEAAAKALGCGIGDVRWIDLEITRDERQRPLLRLHGQAATLAEALGLNGWEVSLTHEGDTAGAVVVMLG